MTYSVPSDKANEFRKYLKEHKLYGQEIHKLSEGQWIEFIITLGASAKAIMELDDFYNRYFGGKDK
ncbi:Uncharacterised protein [uncultured archaeon]|nr:Uncharacterised protein [uncultured archaeon]